MSCWWGTSACLQPRHFRGGSAALEGVVFPNHRELMAPYLRPAGTSLLLLQARDHQTTPDWDFSFTEIMDCLPVPVYLP